MRSNFTLAVPAAILSVALAIALGWLAVSLGFDARDAMSNRLAEGKNLRVIDHVHTTTWWVAILGMCVSILAASTAKWWAGPRGEWPVSKLAPMRLPGWRWWTFALLILSCAAFLRAERMNLSLYNDEAYTFRRYIAGQFRPDTEAGGHNFRAAPWVETVYHMSVGNNSPPYSILARLSYEIVQAAANLETAEVHEAAIRMPALLAGLAGILVLGLVARRFGSPDHGLCVMILFALHPWAQRYSTDARGHSLLLLLVPLCLAAILRALHSGTWKSWLAVGLVSFLMVWTFAGAAYPLVAANAGIGCILVVTFLRHAESRGQVLVQGSRWLISNFLAAFAFLLMFLPLASQMQKTLESTPSLQGGPPPDWWINFSSLLAIGIQWTEGNPASPTWLSVSRMVSDGHTHAPAAILVFYAFALVGLLWWVVRTWSGWLPASITLGTPIVGFLAAKATNTYLHLWYVLASLPPLLMLVVGAGGWIRPLPTACRVGGIAVASAAFLLWLSIIQIPLKNQSTHDQQPLREAVRFVRGEVYPGYLQRTDQVLFASFWTDLGIYDPLVIVINSVESLQTIEKNSRETGMPLNVVFGHRRLALGTHADLVEYLENSGYYDHIHDLHASTDAQFNYHVFRFRDTVLR